MEASKPEAIRVGLVGVTSDRDRFVCINLCIFRLLRTGLYAFSMLFR